MNNKWDIRFIKLAMHIATWSKDPSTKVGAIIVDTQNRIVSVGFNGYPHGIQDDDLDDRESKLLKIIHAEQNALAFSYRDVSGFTLYCTHPPCTQCAAIIIQRGIKRIVCPSDDIKFQKRWKNSSYMSFDMFQNAGVIFESITFLNNIGDAYISWK